MGAKKKIHYCWIIIFGTWIVMFYHIGIGVTGLAVFLTPLEVLFGYSKTEVSAIITFASIGALISTIFAGKLSVLLGCRKLIILSGIVSVISFFSFAYCTTLLQFYVVALVLGLSKGAGAVVPATIILNKWFHEKRSTAIGIAFSGSGFGAMIFAPLLARLIESYDVIITFKFTAVFTLLMVVLSGILICDNPEKKGLQPYGASGDSVKIENNGMTLKEAAKTPEYYLLAVAAFFVGLTILGVNNQIPSFLVNLGYSPVFGAMIVSIVSGVLIVGKIIYGMVNDKLGDKGGTNYIYILWFAAIASLLLIPKFGFICFVFAVLSGLGNPIATMSPSLWTTKFFGKLYYDSVYPTIMVIYLTGQALGTIIIGYIADITGRYTPGFALFAILTIIGFSCISIGFKLVEKRQKKTA